MIFARGDGHGSQNQNRVSSRTCWDPCRPIKHSRSATERNGTETWRRRSCQCEHIRLNTHDKILLIRDVPRRKGNVTYCVNQKCRFGSPNRRFRIRPWFCQLRYFFRNLNLTVLERLVYALWQPELVYVSTRSHRTTERLALLLVMQCSLYL
jgi:hypothetical protein